MLDAGFLFSPPCFLFLMSDCSLLNPKKSQWISNFWNTQASLSAPTNMPHTHSNYLSSAFSHLSRLLHCPLQTIKPQQWKGPILDSDVKVIDDSLVFVFFKSLFSFTAGMIFFNTLSICSVLARSDETSVTAPLHLSSKWKTQIQIPECSLIGWLVVCSGPKGELLLTLALVIDF